MLEIMAVPPTGTRPLISFMLPSSHQQPLPSQLAKALQQDGPGLACVHVFA